jgi:hypothetical protein
LRGADPCSPWVRDDTEAPFIHTVVTGVPFAASIGALLREIPEEFLRLHPSLNTPHVIHVAPCGEIRALRGLPNARRFLIVAMTGGVHHRKTEERFADV